MNKKDLFQNLYTVLALIFIAVLISLLAPKNTDVSYLKKNSTTVTGMLACLEPLYGYSSGCVPGIISDEGVRYVLDATNAVVRDGNITQETRVIVRGESMPIEEGGSFSMLGASAILRVATIDTAH